MKPQEQNQRSLRQGDLLLIDLWAKLDNADAVYADITWMAVVDTQANPEYTRIFAVLAQARDAAITFIQKSFVEAKPVFGYQVDDVCRQVIAAAGYGEYFIHRTGHSIGPEVHWKGVNMDNFETSDERKLIDGIGFSIEPGILSPGIWHAFGSQYVYRRRPGASIWPASAKTAYPAIG